MLTIRFESTLENKKDHVYNKLFIFDNKTSNLKVVTFNPMYIDENITKEHIEYLFNVEINDDYKIIMNKPLADTYSFPFKVYVDVTDKCQLECKHCLTKELNNCNELDMNQLQSIIDECNEHGAFLVKIGGGEPLLHPNIEEIIKKFTEAGLKVSMSTNGLLVDENIAKMLKKYRVKTSVSFEGPRELNDYIRGEGHFDAALKALETLSKEGCDCYLRITLTRHMLDEEKMKEMINLARSMNVKLKISYCRPAGNALDNDLLIKYEDQDKYYKIIKMINRDEYKDLISMDEGMQINQDPTLIDMLYNDRICGAANRSFHINTKGNISPCVFLGNDYKEEDSNYQKGDIESYWSEEKGTKFRKVRNIQMPKVCKGCYRLCKYECTATRLYFNHDTEKNDPNCLGGMKKCLTRE